MRHRGPLLDWHSVLSICVGSSCQKSHQCSARHERRQSGPRSQHNFRLPVGTSNGGHASFGHIATNTHRAVRDSGSSGWIGTALGASLLAAITEILIIAMKCFHVAFALAVRYTVAIGLHHRDRSTCTHTRRPTTGRTAQYATSSPLTGSEQRVVHVRWQEFP